MRDPIGRKNRIEDRLISKIDGSRTKVGSGIATTMEIAFAKLKNRERAKILASIPQRPQNASFWV